MVKLKRLVFAVIVFTFAVGVRADDTRLPVLTGVVDTGSQGMSIASGIEEARAPIKEDERSKIFFIWLIVVAAVFLFARMRKSKRNGDGGLEVTLGSDGGGGDGGGGD